MNEVQRARVDKIMALAEAWRTAGGREEHAIREDHLRGAIEALLEQPEPVQEPSYWLGYGLQAHTEKPFEGATPLYTTPPAQPAAWVGLTEEELYAVRVPMSPEEIARAVEAKLREKNGGA
jgi:hypothetical protein